MRDLHILPHLTQGKANAGLSVWLWASFFRLSLVATDCWASLSSNLERLSWTIRLQAVRSDAAASQGLQVSLANVFEAQFWSAYRTFALN